MSFPRQHSRLLCTALAVSLALPVLVLGGHTARADVSVHVRGKVKVRVGRHKKHRVRRVRRHRPHTIYKTTSPGVRLHVGGGAYWSGGVYVGGFAEPPPPPPRPACDCGDHVPAHYYAEPPPPRPVAPAPAATVARPARPELPRLGIGVFAGSIDVDGKSRGEDLGLLGRLRVSDALWIEAEMAKTEMESTRIDRRVGGALLYDFSPRSRWSAHLLAGLGMTHIDVADGTWQSQQEYGELGVGVSWRIGRRLLLAGDVRAGARARVDSAPADQSLKAVAPSSDEEESYTRARLSAILHF